MVTTCKNWRLDKRPFSRARFVRQTPGETPTNRLHPSQPFYSARYYDVTTGEFTSRDPLEYVDGMSMYHRQFQLTDTDPLGTEVKVTQIYPGESSKSLKCSEQAKARWRFESGFGDYISGTLDGSTELYNATGFIIQKVKVRCRYRKDCCDPIEEQEYFYLEAFPVVLNTSLGTSHPEYDPWLFDGQPPKANTWYDEQTASRPEGYTFFELTAIGVMDFFVYSTGPYHHLIWPVDDYLDDLADGPRGSKHWQQHRIHGSEPCQLSSRNSPSLETDFMPSFFAKGQGLGGGFSGRSFNARYECGCHKNSAIQFAHP